MPPRHGSVSLTSVRILEFKPESSSLIRLIIQVQKSAPYRIRFIHLDCHFVDSVGRFVYHPQYSGPTQCLGANCSRQLR